MLEVHHRKALFLWDWDYVFYFSYWNGFLGSKSDAENQRQYQQQRAEIAKNIISLMLSKTQFISLKLE